MWSIPSRAVPMRSSPGSTRRSLRTTGSTPRSRWSRTGSRSFGNAESQLGRTTPALQLDDVALGVARVDDLELRLAGDVGVHDLAEVLAAGLEQALQRAGHVVDPERDVREAE